MIVFITPTVTVTPEEVDRQNAAEEAHEERDTNKKDESEDKRSHPVNPGTLSILTTLHILGTVTLLGAGG